jgi:hypothetical protein
MQPEYVMFQMKGSGIPCEQVGGSLCIYGEADTANKTNVDGFGCLETSCAIVHLEFKRKMQASVGG